MPMALEHAEKDKLPVASTLGGRRATSKIMTAAITASETVFLFPRTIPPVLTIINDGPYLIVSEHCSNLSIRGELEIRWPHHVSPWTRAH